VLSVALVTTSSKDIYHFVLRTKTNTRRGREGRGKRYIVGRESRAAIEELPTAFVVEIC